MDFLSPPPTGVRWLLLDLNSYFASVEQQLNPALRGKPVAVVPMMTDSTCAIAASYEAKAFGVKTGTPIYEAKQMCPGLICVPARHDAYVEYHHKILAEMVLHTPINKVWSIDEMNSRLLPSKRTVEAASALVQRIKDGLRRNVGECITCSIGLASNSYLAKIGSDMQKPDGLTVLEFGALPGKLLDLRLTDLSGIGRNMEVRINRAGIWTIRELWDTTPKQLRKIWGGVEGERFWYRLHGYDVPEAAESDKSVIGHSRVLDLDSRKPAIAMDVCRRLTTKACQRLRRYGLFATFFGISVRTTDGRRWGHQVHLHPADDSLIFVRLTHEMWGMMLQSLYPDAIKKVSVSFGGLQTAAQTTGDLFEHFAHVQTGSHKTVVPDTDPDAEPSARIDSRFRGHQGARLSAAMDEITKAFGPHAVHFGNQPKTQAGYVGTKIAFARVPDMAEFNE